MSNPVTIQCWKAVHTSGTKFYHVIRFVSGTGSSFSIRQSGPNQIFTGLGKMATGTIELDENYLSNTSAGVLKIYEKVDEGYKSDIEHKSTFFPTVPDAVDWCQSNFGKKALDIATAILSSVEWAGSFVTTPISGPSPEVARFLLAPEESNQEKSKDWGTW